MRRSEMGSLEEVRDLAESVARRRALRLWDVEMGGQSGSLIIRVFIDADGGVDLDTVAEVSEELSRGLDLRDPIEGRYTLEVSSPGLERTLRNPEHFSASVGKRAVVKTTDRLVGNSHRVEGVISLVGPSGVTLETAEGNFELPYDVIKSARTVFDWKGR
jgi:ribosome maturation factor RimP